MSDWRNRRVGRALGGFAGETWRSLEADEAADVERFDVATLDDLPPPAQRFLTAALPGNTPLSSTVQLKMEGRIKLGGRWFGFAADQILRAGVGFVWAPVVGGRVVRFTGADVLGPSGARMEFRFHGRVPVVRASGADIARSAAGRLAAETVAWLPQALTPQAGARWEGIDKHRAAVTLPAAGEDVRVEVSVAEDGQLQWLGLQRWKDSTKPPSYAPFGGSVDGIYTTPNRVRIAGSGTVGWDFRTDCEQDGMFFKYRITNARFSPRGSEGP